MFGNFGRAIVVAVRMRPEHTRHQLRQDITRLGASPRRSAIALAILGGLILWINQARADLIFDIDAILLRFGVLPVVQLVPLFATGQAVASNPPNTVVSPIPPGGGIATAAIGGPPPVAIATISANLANDSTDKVAVATPPGNFAGTAVDIAKAVVITPVLVLTGIDVILTISRDPAETLDAYLGPGDTGTLTDNISAVNLVTGATLFDSTTTFSNTSPDIITDSTGQIVWTRAPGFFDGDTGGQPNAFSNNRWVMGPTQAEFTLPIDLNAGQGANIPLDFVETISGTVSGPSIYGFSATIPEPSTLALLSGGILALLGCAYRRRKECRHFAVRIRQKRFAGFSPEPACPRRGYSAAISGARELPGFSSSA